MTNLKWVHWSSLKCEKYHSPVSIWMKYFVASCFLVVFYILIHQSQYGVLHDSSSFIFTAGKGMWASMVSLAQAVQRAVVETNGGTPEALEASHDLELVLQRHRNTFISLLRNPPKNTNER